MLTMLSAGIGLGSAYSDCQVPAPAPPPPPSPEERGSRDPGAPLPRSRGGARRFNQSPAFIPECAPRGGVSLTRHRRCPAPRTAPRWTSARQRREASDFRGCEMWRLKPRNERPAMRRRSALGSSCGV